MDDTGGAFGVAEGGEQAGDAVEAELDGFELVAERVKKADGVRIRGAQTGSLQRPW